MQGLRGLRAFWNGGCLNKGIVLFVAIAALGLLRSAFGGTTAPATAPTAAPAAAPTVAQTQPTTPPAPTDAPAVPVPLTMEGLTPVLLRDGDLPAGWTGGEVYPDPPVDYDGPAASVVLNQGLNEPGQTLASGNVVLWVFASEADAEAAFANRSALIGRVVDADAERLAPAIGDQALLIPGHGGTFIVNQLLFRRCRAVVEIDQGLAEEVDQITTYGQRLDARIQPTACA